MRDQLLHRVRAATAAEYEVLGALARDAHHAAYLARELASGRLVVFRTAEYAEAMEILPVLDERVPATGLLCPSCGEGLASWSGPCPRCATAAGEPQLLAEELLQAVREAAADSYELLGALPRAGGSGPVFFARDRADGRLVALALGREGGGTGEHFLAVTWEAPAGLAAEAGAEEAAEWGVADGQPTERMDPGGTASTAGRRRALAAASGGVLLVLLALAGVRLAQTSPSAQAAAAAPASAANAEPGVVTLASMPALPPEAHAPAVIDSAPTPEPAVAVAVAEEPASRREAAPARPATGALVLEGELPVGWTVRVGGRARRSSRTLSLPAGKPVRIGIEAPGFCPATHTISVAAGEEARLTPQLHGRPMIGDCEG